MNRRYLTLIALALVVAVPAFAAHSWSTYHWSKPGAEVTAPVTMNLSGAWPSYASRVMADWNASTVIGSPWSFGAISNVKRCASATGKIEVCNASYGSTGWLGIAGISLSGGHIVKGYTKLNDTYYNTAKYNTPEWRQMVFCQEIGHNYGLGHTDEAFDNVNHGTCMDYTNAPGGGVVNGFNYGPSNLYPNAHDYDQLKVQYNHTNIQDDLPFDSLVSDATRPRVIEEIMNKAEQWGTPIAFDAEGRPNVFFMQTAPNSGDHDDDKPITDGQITHIFWAPVDTAPDDTDGTTPFNPGRNH